VVPAGNGQGFINASGQTQIFAPKFTGNLSLDYRTPFIDGTSLVLSAQYYHNSGYDSEVGGRLNISSYDTLGVSGSVFSPGEKYFVKVWGKNITDAHIVAYTDASGEGDRFDYYRPATYGITLGAKF
jgi:iron complex outermembrane receptor protein